MRLILVWNRDDKYPPFGYVPDPKDWPLEDLSYSWIKRRNKLSVAFSADDGRTWSAPVVIASTENEKVWIAYAVFLKLSPAYSGSTPARETFDCKSGRKTSDAESGRGPVPMLRP